MNDAQFKEFCRIFEDIFTKNGISEYDTPENRQKFATLAEYLIEENQKYNLTALCSMDKIIPLHFADCVVAAKYIPAGAKVLDLGCGGGFPTLPLAIVRPDIAVCGLDSTAKKLGFINSAAQKLGIFNVTTLTGRAEELVCDRRESFDIVISRAVARLNVLAELCLPFVQVGGKFIALKGSAGEDELAEAQKGIVMLGGSVKSTDKYDIFTCGGAEKRLNIIIDKQSPTPIAYPRQFGAIKKKPL
ncbi:MAG: 16S rRNA (guanine(527)-N(7))-methyltransferase RsmG [Ruminococcaceae bacterium]|nr:16S rRNA (guanine(527)-N(7))-methyltransferase RsmG [Oscillospiraceae bacterium]